MPDLGNLIHCAHDEDGEIHVYDDGRHRYLTFGNGVEQSCMALAEPARLVHVYTQAMLLALLLCPRVDGVLLAGLGGGSLARALRRARPSARLTALEQRAAVIPVARDWFGLPEDRRFRVIQAEAGGYLAAGQGMFDLILSDLYLAEGMDPLQTTLPFLVAAHARLQASGILVINRWASEYAHHRQASASMSEVFEGRVLHLHVQGGNIISFAMRGDLFGLERRAFFEQAQRLGMSLAIPMQRHARNLWRQNAAVLGVGRFAARRSS